MGYSRLHDQTRAATPLTLPLTFLIFALKSLKYPSPCFDIRILYHSVYTNKTHSCTWEVIHLTTEQELNLFFTRIPCLWSTLPPLVYPSLQ